MKLVFLNVFLLVSSYSLAGEFACSNVLTVKQQSIKSQILSFENHEIRDLRDHILLNRIKQKHFELANTEGKIWFFVSYGSEKWVATTKKNKEENRFTVSLYRFYPANDKDRIRTHVFKETRRDLSTLIGFTQVDTYSAHHDQIISGQSASDKTEAELLEVIDFRVSTRHLEGADAVHYKFSFSLEEIGHGFEHGSLAYSILNIIYSASEKRIEVGNDKNWGALDYEAGTYEGLTDVQAEKIKNAPLVLPRLPERTLEELIRGKEEPK